MVTREQQAIEATAVAAERHALPGQRETLLAAAWTALGAIPDPEVPAISIVELGIVRDVALEGDTLVVTVTPTYSGCPATEMIADDIRQALDALGVPQVDIRTVLAPAWTTDWIAPEARAKLRTFGIAPPRRDASRVDVAGISPLRNARDPVECPRCGGSNTRLVSQFGSTACKAHYRCEACGEPFDFFKEH